MQEQQQQSLEANVFENEYESSFVQIDTRSEETKKRDREMTGDQPVIPDADQQIGRVKEAERA